MSDRARPLIAVCANQAWNLVNFRAGLIEGLRERGFAIHAVAPPDAAMEARLAELGCGYTPVRIDAAGMAPHRDIGTFLTLRRVIADLKPAAWLSWTIKPNVYGALAAGLAEVPALPNVSGLGTAFIRRNFVTGIVKQLYRHGFQKAPTVFFQNEDDRTLFLEEHLVREDQARILPGSGIDPTLWSPPSGGARPTARRFLMLSRVVADKGVREFVTAARGVRVRWPDARFILMGEVAPPNRTAIARAELQSWIDEGVIEYKGPIDDVRPEIAKADFVVLPSYREGLSRVLLEAAAMGRPIITTDVTGCRDVVRDGVNGFLCTARDAASLTAAIDQAAAMNDTTWLVFAKAGRARVVAEFSQQRVTALYLDALSAAGVTAPTKS